MSFWVSLWTVVWFGGLAVFSYLTVLVTVNGYRDLRSLMQTLAQRHAGSEPPAAP